MVGFSSFCNGCVGAQIAVVKQLIGRSGTLAVTMLSVESLAVRGALLLAAQDNTGAIHELETTEKLLTIPVDHDLLPAASAPSVAPQAVAQGEQPELNFAAAHVPL